MTKYSVHLTEQERKRLENYVKTGIHSARSILHAQILLKSDEGLSCPQIVKQLSTSRGVVYELRQRFTQEGIESTFHDRPRSGQPRKVTPEVEAKLTALACEEPPITSGRDRWTIELLRSSLKERFHIVLGWGTVKGILKDHQLKPWKKKNGAFPRSQTNLLTE